MPDIQDEVQRLTAELAALKQRPSIVNRNTLIPLSIAVTIFLSGCGAVVWLNSQVKDFTHSMETLNNHVVRLDATMADMGTKIDGIARDQWIARDMKAWVKLFAAQNTELTVPLPD